MTDQLCHQGDQDPSWRIRVHTDLSSRIRAGLLTVGSTQEQEQIHRPANSQTTKDRLTCSGRLSRGRLCPPWHIPVTTGTQEYLQESEQGGDDKSLIGQDPYRYACLPYVHTMQSMP